MKRFKTEKEFIAEYGRLPNWNEKMNPMFGKPWDKTGFSIKLPNCTGSWNIDETHLTDKPLESTSESKLDLIVGKWYYFESRNSTSFGVFKYSGQNNINVSASIGYQKIGSDKYTYENSESFTGIDIVKGLATDDKIKEALLYIADQKGYKEDVRAASIASGTKFIIDQRKWHYEESSDTLLNCGWHIYKQGVWATIIPEVKKVNMQDILEKVIRDYTIGVKFKSISDNNRIREVQPFRSNETIVYSISGESVICENGMLIKGEDGKYVCSNPRMYENGKFGEIVSAPDIKPKEKVMTTNKFKKGDIVYFNNTKDCSFARKDGLKPGIAYTVQEVHSSGNHIKLQGKAWFQYTSNFDLDKPSYNQYQLKSLEEEARKMLGHLPTFLHKSSSESEEEDDEDWDDSRHDREEEEERYLEEQYNKSIINNQNQTQTNGTNKQYTGNIIKTSRQIAEIRVGERLSGKAISSPRRCPKIVIGHISN